MRLKKNLSLTFTLLRIVLSLIIMGVILSLKNNVALALFIFASVISFLDSYIERMRGPKLKIKGILNPFADKLLINLTALALAIEGFLPFFVFIAFISRDILVLISSSFLAAKEKITILKQNIFDKSTLFFQTIILILAILDKVDPILLWVSIFLTVASALISFVNVLRKSGIMFMRKSELDEYNLLRLIKLPDLLTLGNAVSGILCILFSINGDFTLAMFMLFIAVILDALDGKVALLIKRQGNFGKELDSLADTVSFGIAPAIFGYTVIQTNLAVLSFIIFLFCGLLRLARYNIMEMKGGFKGLPITMNGVIIPLVYFSGLSFQYYPYIYLFLGFLMVSSINFKRVF
ncbi:MAG: CDP-diacylglycerol--serine O-phosphatidyltransferase [Nanoarchaeota archaeon]